MATAVQQYQSDNLGNPRQFFATECDAMERELLQHFQQLREVLESRPLAVANVICIVLGGGYGRGEGGLIKGADGSMRLHNDLDYFAICHRKDDPATLEVLREIERRESLRLGIDVEIARITERDLGNDPCESMMFCDLVVGYKLIWGTDVLRRFASMADPARIVPEEATRLLWNRASGLCFARRAIELTRDVDFIQRNHQKCALALGDAILVSRGLYTGRSADRFKLFQELSQEDAWVASLLPLYEKAVEYKLRPQLRVMSWNEMEAENEELANRWATVFLELESTRLGRRYDNLREYAEQADRLFPKFPRMKAMLIAVRDTIRHGSCLSPIMEYPRGALIRALCHLLMTDQDPGEALNRILPGMRINPHDPPGRHDWLPVYEDWWRRYS